MDILTRAAQRGRTMASSSKLNDSYSDEEREFLQAMDRYKSTHRRWHPTCCEILAVFKSLGYSKAPKQPIQPAPERPECDDD